MKKERITVPVGRIELNKGQCAPWLPSNPRIWTKADLERMKDSIQEDPDWLDDEKAPAVVAVPGKKNAFLVFAGNMRTAAAQQLYDKARGVNVWLYTPESSDDEETIRRRAIKDNGYYGSNDWDALANEWPQDKLEAWGVPVWQAPETPEDDADAQPVEGKKDTGEVNVGGQFAYGVRVNCRSLEEQLQLIRRLNGEGYDCEAL